MYFTIVHEKYSTPVSTLMNIYIIIRDSQHINFILKSRTKNGSSLRKWPGYKACRMRFSMLAMQVNLTTWFRASDNAEIWSNIEASMEENCRPSTTTYTGY